MQTARARSAYADTLGQMATERAALLPLHEFLARLGAWQTQQTPDSRTALDDSFRGIVTAYDARGARLVADTPSLPGLTLATGSLTPNPADDPRDVSDYSLDLGHMALGHASLANDEPSNP